MRKGVNRVALRLFEHNEKAYHATVRMMEQYGKAAIVHPTGKLESYIASEMTLGEAVVRGILPTPNYVTAVYQYQKDLARYQMRVDNLRSPGIHDANQNIWMPCAVPWNRRMVWIGSLPIISQTNLESTSCSAPTRSTWTRWYPMCRSGLQGSTQMW